MKFRYHRGGFTESMQTAFEVRGFRALDQILERICSEGFATSKKDLIIEYYSYDDRLFQPCYSVSHKNEGVIGFLWDL